MKSKSFTGLLSGGRETIFVLGFKDTVDEKGSNDFNDFSRSVDIGQFTEKTFVSS